MLHSTQTTKKHIGNLILRFGMAGLLAAGLFFSAPYSAAAETVPSAENTDAGEITIHFTHYDAQDLEFYLNTDQAALAFTDATLTFQDSQFVFAISEQNFSGCPKDGSCFAMFFHRLQQPLVRTSASPFGAWF